MVQIVNPQKHETVLDPACGTAGFLISSYKHILKENSKKTPGDLLTPEERKKLLANFKGYDISPDMVRLSLVNMYLHGFVQPQIIEYDTLTSEERWNEYVDVILANPPFMSPKGGIKPHKKFSVQSNRSEVLFVDYIAEHLTPTGRAAVIVPEGIIFQSATAYKTLRKMLVENHLYAVVSLPAGIFNPYSGVKTSILFMDRQLGRKTDSILFLKIENDGFDLGAQRRQIEKNDLPDAVNVLRDYLTALRNGKPETFIADEKPCGALLVKKEKLAENGEYNLTGDRYRAVVVRKHQKWPMVRINEIAEFSSGLWKSEKEPLKTVKILRNTNFLKNGYLDLNDVAEHTVEIKQLENRLLNYGDILLEKSGGGPSQPVGRVALFNLKTGEYSYSNFISRIRIINNKADSIYVWACLNYLYQLGETEKLQKQTSGIRNLDINAYKSLQIPLPPIEVQREIVAEIEGYQKLIDGCRQVVDSWKPDIQGYLDEELKLYLNEQPERRPELVEGWPLVKLGEACDVISGQSPEGEYYNDQGIGTPFYQGKTEFTEKYIGPPVKWTTQETKIAEKDDILMSVRAPVGPVNISTQSICIGRGLAAIRVSENILVEYLFTLLKFNEKNIKGNGGAVFDSINRKDVEAIQIPLPPIEVQQKIVAKIGAERKVIDSCRELIKTYEDKIKRVIDKVWEE